MGAAEGDPWLKAGASTKKCDLTLTQSGAGFTLNARRPRIQLGTHCPKSGASASCIYLAIAPRLLGCRQRWGVARCMDRYGPCKSLKLGDLYCMDRYDRVSYYPCKSLELGDFVDREVGAIWWWRGWIPQLDPVYQLYA